MTQPGAKFHLATACELPAPFTPRPPQPMPGMERSIGVSTSYQQNSQLQGMSSPLPQPLANNPSALGPGYNIDQTVSDHVTR